MSETMTTPGKGPLMSFKEVVQFLGTGRWYVRTLVEAKVLKPIKVKGTRPKYRRKEVEKLVEG